jgi:hypothetical protein
MNSQFKLQQTNIKNYEFVILSVDYARIDEYLDDIANNLKGFSYKGKMLFDLVMSNGLSDRFYEAYFDGQRFDNKSFIKLTEIPCSIIEISNNFYRDNLFLLDNSVLTKPQKFLFKKSLVA